MRRSTTDRIAPVLVFGGALAAFPTAAGHFFARDKVSFGGELHFAGVGLTALAATAAAVALTIIGARRHDGRVVLIVGATGGVGSFLTQLASGLGAKVIAVAGALAQCTVKVKRHCLLGQSAGLLTENRGSLRVVA
jgi:hypothetical protein